MYRYFFILLLPILSFAKFQVTVTLPFEAFIVKQIGQKYIRIKQITKLHSSAIRTFKNRELSLLSNTKIYFHFNLNIEKEYVKILKDVNSNLIISDMSRNVKKLKFNGFLNPYIWLDPILLRIVAKNIYDSLCLVDSFNKNKYLKNYNIFLSKLDETYLKTRKELMKSDNYNIFVYDEYFDYYAKRFKINLYRKEKKLQRTKNIKNMNKLIKINEIKSILILQSDNMSIAKSIAGNSKIEIKKHNIYDEFLFLNIDKLTKQFTK